MGIPHFSLSLLNLLSNQKFIVTSSPPIYDQAIRNSCVTRSDDLPYYSCVAKSFEEESTECKCFYKSLLLVRKWIEDGWQDNLRDCLGGLDPTVPQDWDPRDPERRLTKLFPKVMHRPSWGQVWSLMYHLSQLLFHWNQMKFHVSYGSI